MIFDAEQVILGTYILVGFTTFLYAVGGLLRGAFKTAYFALATLISATLVFIVAYHASVWWFFATPDALLSFVDAQLGRFDVAMPAELLTAFEHAPTLYLAVMIAELALKVVFFIALFGIAIYIVRFFLFRIPWWFFFNKMRYTYETETNRRGKPQRIRKKKPQRRLIGMLIGGVQGALIGLLAFVPVTALASLFDNFDPDMMTGDMWEAEGIEIAEVVEYSHLVRQSGAGSYAASFPIGEKTLDIFLFDMALSARNRDPQNPGRVALREELKIVMDMIPILDQAGVLDENFDPDTLTREQVETLSGLFHLLGESKLIPLALPVAAEYAVQLEAVQEVLAGYEPDLSVLYDIDWAGELNRFGDVFLAAFDVMEGQSFDDVDFFDLPQEKIVMLFHKIAALEVVEKLVPIAVDYALQREDVLELLDGMVLDLSDIVWQDEVRNLGDLLEAFLEIGLERLDDLDAGFDVLKLIDYDALEVVVQVLFRSELLDVVLRGVIERLSLDFVPDAYYDVAEQIWQDIDVPNLDFENEFLAVVNLLRVVSLLDFDEEDTDKLMTSIGQLSDNDIDRLIAALMQSVLLEKGLEPLIIRLLEEAELDHWIIVKPDMDIVWQDELRAVFVTVRNVFESPIDFDDFEKNSPAALFGNIDLDILMRSKILTTSFAHFLVAETAAEGMLEGFVFIDYDADDAAWFDVYDGDTLLVKGEVRKLFEAIFILIEGLDATFEEISEDPTALNLDFLFGTLGRNEDGGIDDFDRVLASNVIYQTLDRLIQDNLDVLEEALPIQDFTLTLPSGMVVGEGVDEGRILRAEIRALVEAAKALGFDDIDGLDFSETFLLELDVATVETVLDASLIYMLIEAFARDFLSTQGFPMTAAMMETDAGFSGLLARAELVRVFRSFSLLGLTELDTFNASFSLVTDLIGANVDGDGDDFDRLLASEILHAIIADLLLGIDALTIPASVRYIEPNGVELITREELRAVIEAVTVLGLDSDAFDFDFGNLLDLDDDDLDTLLASRIIHETLSSIILDLPAVVVPDFAHEAMDASLPLAAEEIKHLWRAAMVLSLDESLDFSLETVGTLAVADLDTIFTSDIIYATVEDVLQGTPVSIPAQALEDSGPATGMIRRDEVKALIRAVARLGITGDDFTVDLESTSLLDDEDWDVLLASVIIRQTISGAVAPIVAGLASAPPSTIYEDVDTELISEQELRAFFRALSLLGIADGDSVPVDLNHITGLVGQNVDDGEDDMHRVLQSDILYAQLSDLIINGLEGVLFIPSEAYESDGDYEDMVKRTEIYDLTAALVDLGLNDFSAISFDFDNDFDLATDAGIDALADQMRILNTSYILRAELDRAVDTMLAFVGIVHVDATTTLDKAQWDEEIDTLSSLLKTAGGSGTLGAGLDFNVYGVGGVDQDRLNTIEALLKLTVDSHKIDHTQEIPRMMAQGLDGIFGGDPALTIDENDMDPVTPNDAATWYLEIEALMVVLATGSTFAAVQTPENFIAFEDAIGGSQLLAATYTPTFP
ncbi:MAG: hypothetical protein EA374_06535 [Acholeplasmatales bacterium]|nr:MAG: hypothetical protein EA374_06535 [Acholeplasmatales bacterium]